MPYKKTHPGLDEAMSDEALDRFMAGAPTELVEAPPQRWPTVAIVATLALTVAVVASVLAAGWVTAVDVVVVAVVTAGAVTVLLRLDRPGRDRR